MCGVVLRDTGSVCTLDFWIVGAVVLGNLTCLRLLVGVWLPTLDSAGMIVDRLVDNGIGGMVVGNKGGDMVDGLGRIIALSNIAANSCRAANCDGVLVNGDFGDGCFRAAVSSLAASMAAPVDDVPGMFNLCGKNSTVRATLSRLVLEMYIRWH